MKWWHWLIAGLCVLAYHIINVKIFKNGDPSDKKMKWLDKKSEEHYKSFEEATARKKKRAEVKKIKKEKHIDFHKNINRMSISECDDIIKRHG